MTSPIIIRGVEYPDKKAVAAAFGVCIQYVRTAIRRGRQDFIGIPAHKTRKRTGQEPLPVRVGGRKFKSREAAAKFFGVTYTTVAVAIIEGREDHVGLGTSRKHRKRMPDHVPVNAQPVKIGAREWPSVKRAAIALGVSRTSLRDHMRAGDEVWLAARLMDLLAREAGQNGKVPASQDKEALSQMGRARWERRRQIEEARAQ